MRVRWREFELPARVTVDQETLTPTYGRFVAEPFERGFGITVGNSLRRVLLSSIEGHAVTSVRIEGVQHEFSTIPGVVEDVTDIVLNVKKLLVKMHTDEPQRLRIEKSGKGTVKAADIIHDALVEIVNPDLYIATLADDGRLIMDLQVERGRGYKTAEEHIRGDQEIGLIPVDSVFGPVVRVRYRTENTRVGQLTNYDKLILDIWTDGTVDPERALVEASKILRKHLNPFVQYFETGKELQQEGPEDVALGRLSSQVRSVVQVTPLIAEILQRPLGTLDLSVRAGNCLEAEGLGTIADLVAKTEDDLLLMRNLGSPSIEEIKEKLGALGLGLGAQLVAEEAKEGSHAS